jgi:predicted transposase/invertase (TIGR01784 family)
MDNAILKAEERQHYVASDEDALRIYEMREKAEWDRISGINHARQEGMDKGIKKGRKEGLDEGIGEGIKKGRLEVARNALVEGATPEFVQKITGLDLETINHLAQK